MWDVAGRLGALLRGCGALMLAVMLAGPADAQDSELWKRFAGAWEGRGEQAGTDGWTIFIVLDPPGKGKISYPSLDCGGTLALLESRRNALVFHEQIHLGQDRCVPQGEVTLILNGESELLFEYRARGNQTATSLGKLRRVADNAAPAPPPIAAQAPAPAAGQDWRTLVPEGSRFKGQVRSEPKYVGGPRRTYDVDIDFKGDLPVVRIGIGQTENGFTCLGAIQLLRLLPPSGAAFSFGKMSGRGDMIIDCPESTEVRIEKVPDGLSFAWAPPGREPVSGILADKTAEIAAKRAAEAEAARNAQPCTHVKWNGPQSNIADALLCDEGKAISLFRKGAVLNLSVTDVSFAEGRLIGTARIDSRAGKGSVEVVCLFPQDSDMELSTGDAIAVEARLSSYSGGRLVFDCDPPG